MSAGPLGRCGLAVVSRLTRQGGATLNGTASLVPGHYLFAADAAQPQSRVASALVRWTGVASISTPARGGAVPRQGSLPADKYDDKALEEDAKLEQYKLNLDSDKVWPTTLRQSKFGSRLRKALDVVLTSDPAMVSLARSTGFGIEEVRMSRDLQTAFILWDAYPKRMDAAERGITRNMCRLRAMTSKKLGAKFMPWLEFRRDELTSEQKDVAELMQEWEAEMEATGELDVHEGERKEWSIDVEPSSLGGTIEADQRDLVIGRK